MMRFNRRCRFSESIHCLTLPPPQSSSRTRSPATDDIGSENEIAPEGVPTPQLSAMAFMMAAFSPALETISTTSFSSASETPRNFWLSAPRP